MAHESQQSGDDSVTITVAELAALRANAAVLDGLCSFLQEKVSDAPPVTAENVQTIVQGVLQLAANKSKQVATLQNVLELVDGVLKFAPRGT